MFRNSPESSEHEFDRRLCIRSTVSLESHITRTALPRKAPPAVESKDSIPIHSMKVEEIALLLVASVIVLQSNLPSLQKPFGDQNPTPVSKRQ
jgi:hypothetical protein